MTLPLSNLSKAAPNRVKYSNFFMKDLYDHGMCAVRGQYLSAPQTSWDIVQGYTLLDDAIDATGKPNRDFHIWTGLARLLITAGDISHAAIDITTARDMDASDQLLYWQFGYDLDDRGGDIPFMWVYPTTESADQCAPAFPHKPLGPIAAPSYLAKLGSYPMMVNPALAQRATAALNYILVQYLTEAGLSVDQHWVPEDTSLHIGRYHLTDGIDHYLIDYDAPALARALSIIDRAAGRTAADGAILIDDNLPDDTTEASVASDSSAADDMSDDLTDADPARENPLLPQ
jgi:hypothetical protein